MHETTLDPGEERRERPLAAVVLLPSVTRWQRLRARLRRTVRTWWLLLEFEEAVAAPQAGSGGGALLRLVRSPAPDDGASGTGQTVEGAGRERLAGRSKKGADLV